MRFFSTAALFLGILSATAFAADQVPNPAYKAWSSFKPGSSATLQGEMKPMAGEKESASMTMTRKLVELTAEKAIIETTVTINAGGQLMNIPAKRQEIPATVDADKVSEASVLGDQAAGESKPDIKQGEEEISVLDKKLKCHWFEMTTARRNRTVHLKAWTSPAIPGSLVQTDTRTEGMSNTLKLTAYEAK